MPKYYYNCPIEAAYMAKNFGMKFTYGYEGCEVQLGKRGLEIYSEPMSVDVKYFGSTPEYKHLSIDLLKSDYRLHIQSASLVILEPQKDDVVDLGKHGFGFVVERDGNNIDCALLDINTGVLKSGFWHRRWHPIAFRSGKSFIMPQEEK